MPTQISEYNKFSFAAKTNTGHEIVHDVYSLGQGKVCVIIQELPGIGQQTLELADRFVARGYRVVLPHLFGPLGKTSKANLARVFCMRKEFHLFAANQTSPIVDWLGALCAKLKSDFQVPGVAVIGMCITGNFAISLMADDSVLAAFASQPSMPLFNAKALHLSAKCVEKVKSKLDRVGPMHSGRFAGDHFCKAVKFERIDQEFNKDKKRVILHELPGEGHSILTLHFDKNDPDHQNLLSEIMDYFDQQLS